MFNKKSRRLALTSALLATFALAGCQTSGNDYRSDVYTTNQVNQAQEVMSVNIIAINPAQIRVRNANQESLETTGAILGAVIGGVLGNQAHHHRTASRLGGAAAGAYAGSTVANAFNNEGQTVVEGVQLIYKLKNGRMLQSAQVGRLCEFSLGPAIMVMPSQGETRIQPNNPMGCPQPKK